METLINVGGRTKLFPKDVAYFQADINYTIIHFTEGKKKIVATTLGRITQKVGSGFIRPNKSFLINLEYINQINLGEIELQDNLKINISRRKKNLLVQLVENHIENKNLLNNL